MTPTKKITKKPSDINDDDDNGLDDDNIENEYKNNNDNDDNDDVENYDNNYDDNDDAHDVPVDVAPMTPTDRELATYLCVQFAESYLYINDIECDISEDAIWKKSFQALTVAGYHGASRVNSLAPSDAIWEYGTWSILVQVMACWLTAPSHYMDQYWVIISGVHPRTISQE